ICRAAPSPYSTTAARSLPCGHRRQRRQPVPFPIQCELHMHNLGRPKSNHFPELHLSCRQTIFSWRATMHEALQRTPLPPRMAFPLAACLAILVGVATGAAAADWPTYLNGPARAGATTDDVGTDLHLSWKFSSPAPP